MKKNRTSIVLVVFLTLTTLVCNQTMKSQNLNNQKVKPNHFWEKVQFGGGLGLGFGTGFTNISLSPTAIYNINDYFSLGAGVQYSYVRQKNIYTSNLYGGSIIGLINPVEQIQLSAELEQLRVNVDYGNNYAKENFWNTGLFLGAGFRNGNITIGGRYNVLFNKNDSVYTEAFMPFVRVFF
ncbi:hypothetical protein [Flavobacterium sp.]|uniref:hypothetical protein n=1 Tax=Flavobacterium sp. TaxID=239 RepID=UPI0038FC26B3